MTSKHQVAIFYLHAWFEKKRRIHLSFGRPINPPICTRIRVYYSGFFVWRQLLLLLLLCVFSLNSVFVAALFEVKQLISCRVQKANHTMDKKRFFYRMDRLFYML
jgi:hypothetical protein